MSNLNLDSIKTVKANIDGFCGSNAQANGDGSIIFCHKSFVKFEKRDRLAMLWHEIYHTNYDNKSFDPRATQELRPREFIRNIPERIKTLMKKSATYDFEDWNTPNIRFKEDMINQYYDSMLEVEWIHHPLYYENEVTTYEAEMGNPDDVSYYYRIEREIQLWIKEQYWEISKRRWIYQNY